MPWWDVLALVLAVTGAACIIDGVRRGRRTRQPLDQRLKLYQPSVADEVERWLQDRSMDVWDPDWVTVADAASRLRMSPSWFKAWAKESGVKVVRRGNRPGVNWPTVEQVVSRSRIDAYREQADPEGVLPGVGIIAAVLNRHGWSARELAGAVGVHPATVTKWRAEGVPVGRMPDLESLLAEASGSNFSTISPRGSGV